jgi:hypothetical protein
MLIVADNDVPGQAQILESLFASPQWSELAAVLDLEFASLEDIGLLPDAPDRMVWMRCQELGAVLLTGNRTGGSVSLDETIRQLGDSRSLPVLTISEPQRLKRDSSYREACALRLLDFLDRLDALRGVGRLFIP